MRASAAAVKVNEEAEEESGEAEPARATATPTAPPAPATTATPGPKGLYMRVRAALARRRIRMHLVSGIEFQMFAFIVGPLTGLILPMVAVTGGLLLLFELGLIYRFAMAARHYVPPVNAEPVQAGAASTPARV